MTTPRGHACVTGELRCRSLSETLELARSAAVRAGVTRVSDITAFAVPGIPVFQATRPEARSLTVSQGKGLTPTAAIVGALLETVEFHAAEGLAASDHRRALAELAERDIAIWSGERDVLAIDLDRTLPRAWLPGTDLFSGEAWPVPWDMLSLDFTRPRLDYPATSNGLACGNDRTEALVSSVAELLEHHCKAQFDRLAPRDKRAAQIALATIGDPLIRRLMGRIERAGFDLRAWSMGNEIGLAAIQVTMFEAGSGFDDTSPVSGNGCHADARVAFLRAMLEAVQTRAGLVAGARDDLTADEYATARERTAAVFLGALAYGDGPLDWRVVPTADCASSERCLDFLLGRVQRVTSLPVIAYDHEPPYPGLHLAHVLAPGLMDLARRPERIAREPAPPACAAMRSGGRSGPRKVLFGGPSIAGLAIPDRIELRPPARCGDLAALIDDPPEAVALVDGIFKVAPTVWHKEILSLLALGTRVIGGASLGALRAAELERFGMEGVGAIFHAYRGGTLVRDDAVMLIHAPVELGYPPLSLPLVDAEHALSGAAIPPHALRTMQRILRTTPFEARTWRRCLAEYSARTGEPFPLSLETLEAAPSLKRLDARLVVDALAADRASDRSPRCPAPPVTGHYRRLLEIALFGLKHTYPPPFTGEASAQRTAGAGDKARR